MGILGFAIYYLVVAQSWAQNPTLWTTAWVMFGTGLLTFLTAVMGGCAAKNHDKVWLCVYGCFMFMSLLLSAIYLGISGTALNGLVGATACNFNPSNTWVGYDCSAYF